MKTLTSIVGIGVLSMTVALAPAFAQQSKPMDQSGTATTVQPKTDTKAPAMGKDAKSTPAKPGSEVKNEGTTARPAPDMKSSSATGQSKPDTKASAAGVTGKDEKNTPAKPSTDAKSGSVSGKSNTTVKDEKGAPVKPGASLKNDKPEKSVHQSKVEGKSSKTAMKASHKHASAKHVKRAHRTRTAS